MPNSLPYKQRNLLTDNELAFYRALKIAIGDKATICPKVRLIDILDVPFVRGHHTYKNKIISKHTDFVLCNPHTTKPIAGIELDDSTHLLPDRQARDQLINNAYQSAGIQIFHFPSKRYYDSNEIAEKLSTLFETPKPKIAIITKPPAPNPNIRAIRIIEILSLGFLLIFVTCALTTMFWIAYTSTTTTTSITITTPQWFSFDPNTAPPLQFPAPTKKPY